MKAIKPIGVICIIALVGFLYAPGSSKATRISGSRLSTIYGGCDIDCEEVDTGCNTRPACTEIANESDECELELEVCTDTTNDETCTLVTTWGIDCVVDPAHDCSPQRKLSGACTSSTGTTTGDLVCKTLPAPGTGDCGTTASQCHY